MRFPLRKSSPQEPPPPEAPAAPPPIPFPAGHDAPGTWDELLQPPRPAAAPLKGQASAADARAERLIRQVRKDLDRLQASLDRLAVEQADLLAVDPAAAAAAPEAAAALPPPALVRALVALHEENRALRKQLRKARKQRDRALQLARSLELTAAGRDARLAALEEVIAALHGNLQDLRQHRDLLVQREPAALRDPGAGTLPPPGGPR
jgi:hypothetical protein